MTQVPDAGPSPRDGDPAGTPDRLEAAQRRIEELRGLSDEELYTRFWDLSHAMMRPVVDLARTHTSPSLERSVLLRMGIDSLSCHGVVDAIADAGLLGKGAGHVVLKLAHRDGLDVRGAAQAIADDPGVLTGLFETTGGAR